MGTEHARGYCNVTLSRVTLPTCMYSWIFWGCTLIPGYRADYQACGPVVPYHAPPDDNQCGQQIPQVQSVADLNVQGKLYSANQS